KFGTKRSQQHAAPTPQCTGNRGEEKRRPRCPVVGRNVVPPQGAAEAAQQAAGGTKQEKLSVIQGRRQSNNEQQSTRDDPTGFVLPAEQIRKAGVGFVVVLVQSLGQQRFLPRWL